MTQEIQKKTLFFQKNRKNWNQNQNWNQQGNQSNAKRPKIDPIPATATATATNFSNQPPSKLSSVQQSPAPKNDQPTTTTPPTSSGTQEELEFDEQFRKWEEEFDKWKKANVNHPDKDAYRQYEQQFESVRVKLLQV